MARFWMLTVLHFFPLRFFFNVIVVVEPRPIVRVTVDELSWRAAAARVITTIDRQILEKVSNKLYKICLGEKRSFSTIVTEKDTQ